MADGQENEEDLFADLYDGDEILDVAPPAKSAPAPAPVSAALPEVSAPNPEPVSADTSAQVNDGNGDYQSYDGGVHQNGQGHGMDTHQTQEPQQWSNNQVHGSWQGQQSEEQERPMIGTKEDGKMFIGGLNWETTDQSLRDYFSQFGEVTDCTVMRDSASGRSRGFGFLTFRDPKCVNTVMVKEHQLDGKIIDPKRAIPRDEQERTSKIFVGGVSQEATEHDFKSFFQQFGRVLDATLMMDKDTGRPRGFGFVTFDSETAVEKTLAGPLEILGKSIEVKKAQPRGNMINDDDGAGRGRGRGRGGFGQQNFSTGQNEMMSGAGGGMMGMGGMGGASGMGGMGGGQGSQQMTPSMMAQYWTRMQQYFSMMQQQMASNQQAGAGGMNPALQQQQQMMQMMMANQNGGSGNMSPQMMQQMQNMQSMQNMQGGGQGGFSPQNQQIDSSQQRQSPYTAPPGSSWEGMYDDVPAPQGQQMDNFRGGGGGGGRGRGNFFPRGRGGIPSGPAGGATPSNAPANAPTGPKNAGRPGANYRGGGRGGRGGFHPYARGA